MMVHHKTDWLPHLDLQSDKPLYEQLVESVALAVAAGELEPGGGTLLIQLLTGLSGLILPDRWMREGMQWRSELLVSPSDPLIPGTMDDVVLRTRTTFEVDSIVRRSLDTLAYISAHGIAAQLRRRADDGVMLAYSGSVAGSLVWSTGYMAFVSAATRLSVNIDVRPSGTAEPARRMTIETTLRQAVVP